MIRKLKGLCSGNVQFLAFLYFLQGLPYGLQSRFLPLFFRSHGMSLSNISYFKLLLAPWMLKALWAPLVDRYGTKKKWLRYSMLGLFLTCIYGTLASPESIIQIAGVLFVFNLLTSTQDIAVDGLAIQVLRTSELAVGNIAQVVGYKLGAVFSGGVTTWLSGIWTLEWAVLFMGLGGFYFLAYLIILQVVPSNKSSIVEKDGMENTKSEVEYTDKIDTHEEAGEHWFLAHLKTVGTSTETRWTLLYVLIYKLGKLFYIYIYLYL